MVHISIMAGFFKDHKYIKEFLIYLLLGTFVNGVYDLIINFTLLKLFIILTTFILYVVFFVLLYNYNFLFESLCRNDHIYKNRNNMLRFPYCTNKIFSPLILIFNIKNSLMYILFICMDLMSYLKIFTFVNICFTIFIFIINFGKTSEQFILFGSWSVIYIIFTIFIYSVIDLYKNSKFFKYAYEVKCRNKTDRYLFTMLFQFYIKKNAEKYPVNYIN